MCPTPGGEKTIDSCQKKEFILLKSLSFSLTQLSRQLADSDVGREAPIPASHLFDGHHIHHVDRLFERTAVIVDCEFVFTRRGLESNPKNHLPSVLVLTNQSELQFALRPESLTIANNAPLNNWSIALSPIPLLW